MGFFDKIFGSEPDVDIQPRSTLNAEQQELFRGTLMPYLSGDPSKRRGSVWQPAKNANDYTAPLGYGEQISLEALEQRALNPRPESQGQNYLQQMLSGQGDQPQASTGYLTKFMNESPQDIDQHFQQSVYNPLMEQFQEDILPAISRRAAGSGNYYSSDRLKQDAEATEDLLSTLGRERTRMAYEGYQDAQNRGLQASSLASQLETQTNIGNADRQVQAALGEAGLDQDRAALELQTLVQNLNAQGLPREIKNQELAKQYADFLRREGARDTHVAQILSALGLQTTENIATVTEGSQGLLGSFLGGGGAGGIMSMFGF